MFQCSIHKINSYTIINFKYVTKINNQNVTLMNSQTFNVSRKSKDIIKNTMPTGGTCNDEFLIFLLYRSITDISP